MPIEFLIERFRERAAEVAIIHRDTPRTFGWLIEAIEEAHRTATRHGIRPGTVVSLEADFSAISIPQLLALVAAGAILVPIAPTSAAASVDYRTIAQVEMRLRVDDGDEVRFEPTGVCARHALYDRLRAERHPGLVLFTSGSTGGPKAALHDWVRLLEKYREPRKRLRTLLFLLFDHIGGVDTLFQALSNGSTVIVPRDRTPDGVCQAIERHRAEVLPASPSFLSLLLLSDADRRHDLSSLSYITYGAEVMPEPVLQRLAARFPDVTLLQKYGLTEVGTLRSHSDSNESLWVRVGGKGFQTRIVDGMLQIRATSTMLGYLNAESPFTDDGWLITGDAVERHGDYIRILGRASDVINVGGQKVYPAEVESVVQELDDVAEVAVRGERHPFTGQIVVAHVRPRGDIAAHELEQRIRVHCRARLAPYKVPMRVVVADETLSTDRDKKIRR